MLKHPEGGYYKETYRSTEGVLKASLPDRFGGDRSFCTGIYFLLQKGEFSAFHRIKSDEMWHFYYGSPLNVYVINTKGKLEVLKLGDNFDKGEQFQAVVPAGSWFASAPADEGSFSLVGCTVSPGFDFADFAMAKKEDLIQQFPQHKEVISKYCR